MGKHIHVHIHTTDAGGFNEADHPRDHGKFTSGGGSKGDEKTASLAKMARMKQGIAKMKSMRVPAIHQPGHLKDLARMEEAFERHRDDHEAKYGKTDLHNKPAGGGKEPSDKDMASHPQFTKEDHAYLKGKGWTNSQIKARWDAERNEGNAPAKGKVKAPDVVGVVANKNFYRK